MAKIGKNVLENLTSGMYEDSKIIYREYIQNAADQIDKAISENMFCEKMYIDIQIDEAKRSIIIKDNATGIPKSLVAKKLVDVADSDKIIGEDKGFRGIGRLGGLAYCKKLRFITTSKGESEKTIMTWDAKSLLDKISDPSVKDDAGTILDDIITYEYEKCDSEEHYFIVELQDIRRENKELLNVEKVRRYISVNAPVPYGSKLIYKSKIKEYVRNEHQKLSEYTIYVNTEDVKKPYTTVLYEQDGNSKKRYDEIYDIYIKEFKRDNGELLAWMWYGISAFVKRIPSKYNEMSGLRLRQSNIQIGDEGTLTRMYKEHRDNFYFIGEVHAVHDKLIPNGRRDYFIENEVRNEFEAQLRYYFKDLHQLFNDANDAKSSFNKDIDLKLKEQKLYDGKFVDNKSKVKLEQFVEEARKENDKAQRKITNLRNKAETNEVLKVVLGHVEENYKNDLKDKGLNLPSTSKVTTKVNRKDKPDTNNKKGIFLVDDLSNLNTNQRKLVSKIYAVITNNLPEQESMALINKIQEVLKR